MTDIAVTRRAVLYGTGAGLTVSTGVRAAEARGYTAAPQLLGIGITELAITVNGEPLRIVTEQCTTVLDTVRQPPGQGGSTKDTDMQTCNGCTAVAIAHDDPTGGCRRKLLARIDEVLIA